MEPVGLDVGPEFALDLAGQQVQPGKRARVPASGDRPGPHLAVDDQQVLGAVVPAAVMPGSPQCLAILDRKRRHHPVPPGEHDDVLVHQQRRGEIGRQGRAPDDRLGSPQHLAVGAIQADDPFAVVEEHPPRVGRERHRHHRVGLLPEQLARIGFDGHDLPRRLIPPPAARHALLRLADVAVHGQERLGPFARVVDLQEHHPVGDDDLLGGLAALLRAHDLARRRVQHRQRIVQAERDVHPLAHGHQPPRKLGRAALEGPQLRMPRRDRPLPQDRPVVCVARDQE
ncbi:hypothetical protein LCGC14_2141700, partial [marine sediment metagenome]